MHSLSGPGGVRPLPAVAYAEHADFTAVPEYLCARTAEYLAICQKALADPAVESDNSGKNGTIS